MSTLVHRADFKIIGCDIALLSVTFCDGQIPGEARYLVSDSIHCEDGPVKHANVILSLKNSQWQCM